MKRGYCAKKTINYTKENKGKNKEELEQARKKKEQIIRSHIGKNLKKYNNQKENIVQAFLDAKSKQDFNNKLQKTFKNKEVSEIRESMKKLIKDLPGK